MTFLTMIGGFLVFGLLWLVFPRASFAFVLCLYLKYQHGVLLFAETSKMATLWDGVASVVGVMLVGIVAGIVLDIIERFKTIDAW